MVVEAKFMRYIKTMASLGVKACLILVALAEGALMYAIDFSDHPFDVFVLSLALGMTLFCLWRSIFGYAVTSNTHG